MRDKSFGNQGSGYPSGMSHSSVSPRPQHQEVPLRMHGEGIWVPNVHSIQLEHHSKTTRRATGRSICLEGRCREEGEETEEGGSCFVHCGPCGISLRCLFVNEWDDVLGSVSMINQQMHTLTNTFTR